jgi:hypothetical protein
MTTAKAAAAPADPWAALRAPFAADEIELLPKPLRKDAPKGKCSECGGYHGLPAVHLSYVGHAGVTMRLLDVDPEWNWEPVATDERGIPMLTDGGNMWIRLTILGVTRLGVGDASGGHGAKEIIGDAIRNAAMRFGVGTYLWSKSEKAKAELTRNGMDDDGNGSRNPAVEPRATEADVRRVHELRVKLGMSDKTLRNGIARDYPPHEHPGDLGPGQVRELIGKMEAALKAKPKPEPEPVTDPKPEGETPPYVGELGAEEIPFVPGVTS